MEYSEVRTVGEFERLVEEKAPGVYVPMQRFWGVYLNLKHYMADTPLTVEILDEFVRSVRQFLPGAGKYRADNSPPPILPQWFTQLEEVVTEQCKVLTSPEV